MRSILLFLLSTAFSAFAATSGDLSFSLSPETTGNGQVSLLMAEPPAGGEIPSDLAVKAGDDAVELFPCPNVPSNRCGFVPVPAQTKTGPFEIAVGWGPADKHQTKTLTLHVREGKFHVTVLKVDPDRSHPSDEELKRAEEEKKELMAAYATGSPTPLWQDKFDEPLHGSLSVTSRYGNRRVFNGELKSVHLGLDLRAHLRTPIYSANAGKVIFCKEMFFAGNVVVVDHGAGVFSSYAHLSKVEVTPGQTIKKGERVGLAGATGRVTGPHLHWGMRVNGILVDPRQMRDVFNRMWAPKH